ncbi:hypothetical protein [Gilvibacter sp.]|uniref:hypothetical protein n=1 Tax=Gilvibacter sp. TaxID=2729997 RepID=UPI003F49EC4A
MTGFGQSIKSIVEYKNINDSLIKTRATYFNQQGEITQDTIVWLPDPISLSEVFKIHENRFVNNSKTLELEYDWHVKSDTRIVRSFSTIEYDSVTNSEILHCYEADSLLRFIREVKYEKNTIVSNTKSWEFNPVLKENDKPDLVLIDTIFLDELNRPIRSFKYNSKAKGPVNRFFTYSKDSVTETIVVGDYEKSFKRLYPELQLTIDLARIDYKVKTGKSYKYEVEYYE